MNLGWQDLAALGIVFAAASYLSRLALSAFTGKSKERLCLGMWELSGPEQLSRWHARSRTRTGRIDRSHRVDFGQTELAARESRMKSRGRGQSCRERLDVRTCPGRDGARQAHRLSRDLVAVLCLSLVTIHCSAANKSAGVAQNPTSSSSGRMEN